MRKKIWAAFAGIIVIAVLAGLVSYPKGPDINIPNGSGGSFIEKELKLNLGLDLQGGTHLVYEADLSNIEPAEYDEAMAGVKDVIERRVNGLGISEPVVQTNKTGDSYRLIVELAGISDVNEAIELIGQTPSLDFRVTSDQPPAQEIQIPSEENPEENSEENTDNQEGQTEDTQTTDGGEENENTEEQSNRRELKRSTFLAQAETTEGEASSEDSSDEEQIEGESGQPEAEAAETQDSGITIEGEGENQKVLDADGNEIDFQELLQSQAQESGFFGGGFEPTDLTGKNLSKAYLASDPTTGQSQVALEFDSEGKKLFAELTEANIGKPIGIFLDGELISAPTVNQKISDGNAVISGSFTLDEAKTLAQRLNAGALPVNIELLSQTTVGSTLGEEAIQKSFFAGLLGLILVGLFMIIYYRLPGLLAVLALALYSLIVLAIFKLLSVTLTLAGIAGFILSVGMAVDANVLIFERIKEELKNGRSLAPAIEEGFKHAWSSIRDSNISSLITCLILAWFGTSIIKGFAITLAIGIIVSMFSAITVTRTFLRLFATPFFKERTWLFK